VSNLEDEVPRKKPRIWLGMLVVLVVLAAIGEFTSSNTTSTQPSNTVGVDNSWVPAGYERWDGTIAYKWVDDPQCNTYSVCAGIRVTANIDCPNTLYAELLLQDKDYVQYDYTNDSQGSLTKGSTAELTFNFEPDERFAHFKLSKISCR
jgi:hypothetical protein